jgi:mannose/cellobiose epimerase-like protein (N-acyl-D-glucosamine 2-epimerase family)
MSVDFADPGFLEDHIWRTLAFYQAHAFDPRGGFFQHFRDDGSVYDRTSRHLVSSTRFVFNYAMAAHHFGAAAQLDWAAHGLAFLEERHRQPSGGYAWMLDAGDVRDATNHCYGLAFVMVAGATALRAGLPQGRATLERAWELLEAHFWDAAHGLYRDEASADFSELSPYRGQNANMHACEGLLWAFEATGERGYLERAAVLADNITRRQAALAGGLVWEHYRPDWSVDWDYNRDNPKHLFRPWGFQPGYGVDPEGRICDGDKYFWVQAESFAAAKLLELASGEARYGDWYARIWQYSWDHMVDHRYGAWFRILTRDNRKYDDLKSPAGKTDYHTMGACYEVLRALDGRREGGS